MRSQPQRPVRTFRVQTDENTAPTALAKQTIHHRHKSTGTLSNMLAVGGLKAAAKRTAFGDVSNTVKNLTTARDDSAVTGKHTTMDFVKPVVAQDKPAAFLRPAQRLINNNTTAKATQAASSAIVADLSSTAVAAKVEVKQPMPALKRVQSRKLPAVFKDDDAQEGPQPQLVDVTTKPESVVVPPVHQTLGARHYPSHAPVAPHLRRTESKILLDNAVAQNVAPAETTDEDAPEEQQDPEDQETNINIIEPKKAAAVPIDDEYDAYLKNLVGQPGESWLEAEENDKACTQQRQLPAPPLVSETEEYWEDEEEEIYDEQGYTTAHSYPSRGDNTTGGATTLLIPKVTNKVKQELAVAKEVVESSRTQEDIEDEAWDTSMVAEYGDEIFAYMRELEVCSSFLFWFPDQPRRLLSKATVVAMVATSDATNVYIQTPTPLVFL
jgi:G2/mitotic-specific cyclin 3/4